VTTNSGLRLGSLTQTMCHDASWTGKDGFPASRLLADEIERVLSFLNVQGQFERYLPMLRGKITQRDGALAEARVAFFFHRNGFRIVSWEPKGASDRFGEFEIQWGNTKPIFVEVKGPRWEGELTEEEKFGPRRKQPKYVNGEARWFDSVGKVIDAAGKAIPKFLGDRPNLLVVVAYLLFVSPRELSRNIVEPQLRDALSDRRFSNLGGIAIFDFHCGYEDISYQIAFVENRSVTLSCALPEAVAKGLSTSNNIFLR
jgi:hypothetical protein